MNYAGLFAVGSAALLALALPRAADADESAAAATTPLVAVAGVARYALTASPEMLLGGLDPESQAVIVDALRMGLPEIPGAIWSRIMVGALQVRREVDASADTLWFNPLLDAGLVVRWVRDDADHWRVLAAAAVTGETLRTEVPTGFIAWPGVDGALATALRDSAARSFASADAGSWNRLFAAAPAAEPELIRHALEADLALEALRRTPGYHASLGFLRELLLMDDPSASKLPPMMHQSLMEMGDTARLSMRPVAAFRLTDGWSVALQSPDAPALIWLAHFADPEPGQPALPTTFNLVGIDDTVQERP